MQLGGYYMGSHMRPGQAYRVFNTWMGDPGKLIILEEILKVIKSNNLLENVEKTGQKLKSNLNNLQKEFPHLLNSLRGRGTFLAINAETPVLRDDLVNRLKQAGIQSGGCGENAIRFRPALIFQEKHVDIFTDKFRQVLKETK